jgi:DNA replication and repair protein RecF
VPLRIDQLQVRSFRNIESLEVAFGPRFNVVHGANGQGKTNLLEAIYVLATSKSFRTSKLAELIAFGAELASVRGDLVERGTSRTQSVGLRRGTRLVRIDDKRPPTLAAYAVRSPVVVFHPGEIALSMGASSERRRLLDRTALYLDAASMVEAESYQRAIRERQRALETRGASASDLGEWEALCVRHGLAWMAHRRRSSERLAPRAIEAFARIADPSLKLTMAYVATAPPEGEAYREALAAKRGVDLRRGSASIGPHRDELVLRICERPVRGVASQGQHRAVTLALKSAEMAAIADARGVMPILLLDDVSSELDRERTAALFAFLRDQEGQVVLTTTRPEIIDTGSGDRVDFRIDGGVLVRSNG